MLSRLLHYIPLLLALSCNLAVRGYHRPGSDEGGDSLAGLAGRDIGSTPALSVLDARALKELVARSYDGDDDDEDEDMTTPTAAPHTLIKRGQGCKRCGNGGKGGKHGPKPKPKKKFQGIDFSRQRQHRFVRFILASSIDTRAADGSSTPVVIDTPNVSRPVRSQSGF